MNWRWCYKYHYPPLMCDLLKYIPYFDTEFIKNNNSNAVLPIVQLSYVLPKDSLGILPSNIQDKLLSNVPEYYSNNWNFQWSCKRFRLCHLGRNLWSKTYWFY